MHVAPGRWDLGWDEHWEGLLEGKGDVGRVAIEQRGLYELWTERGVVRARLPGRAGFAAESRLSLPAVGDWVVYDRPAGSGEAIVTRLLPRKTCLVRNAAGKRTEVQVIAANVDVVMIVTAAGRDHNPRRIQRYMSAIAQSGARPIVVISKVDLADDLERLSRDAAMSAPGAEVLATSVMDGVGLDALARHMTRGTTAVVVGSSGAGKSSLVNALCGADRQHVAGVRRTDERGRHTTTRRELVLLPGGGVILDTPGMRELALWAEGEEGPLGFDDVASLAAACRFRDCRHQGEPGCAVVEAVDAGELEPARLEAWSKLERESARHLERQGGLAEREAKRARKRFAKMVRRITRETR